MARPTGLPQHLSLVTLGVADIARSRAFYEALGFVPAGFQSDSIAFFQMSGTALAVFGREALAADAGVPADGTGFRAVSLAINVESPAEVDAALAHAVGCGATPVKAGQTMSWGGYSGYFADPDGHLWEIAHNPHWPNDTAGHMTLPPPGSDTDDGRS
ncbi:MAG: VOC family protein [Hyphomicrobiaceae bacterium]